MWRLNLGITHYYQINGLIYLSGCSYQPKNKEYERNFDLILNKFDAYFMTKRNIIHEHVKFHRSLQKPTESIEMFAIGLYELAKYYDFSDKNVKVKYCDILDKYNR